MSKRRKCDKACPRCGSTETAFVTNWGRPIPGRFECLSNACNGRQWFEIKGEQVTWEAHRAEAQKIHDMYLLR